LSFAIDGGEYGASRERCAGRAGFTAATDIVAGTLLEL
jgi:hypothetical protein